MEREVLGFDEARSTIEDALKLIAAAREENLIDALRKLTAEAPNLLRTYVLGDELAVAVREYSLLKVDLARGKVTVWDDWRNRLSAAAKDLAAGAAKRLMVVNPR